MSVKFKVHKVKDSDFSSLYKDVPRNILPADYGGEGPSIAELTSKSPIHWIRFQSNVYASYPQITGRLKWKSTATFSLEWNNLSGRMSRNDLESPKHRKNSSVLRDFSANWKLTDGGSFNTKATTWLHYFLWMSGSFQIQFFLCHFHDLASKVWCDRKSEFNQH